ncbi:MAG: hypothetical protein EBX52_02710 [Proteobacteria bacterium]|nr:hypothetical protein [Pseudomonadota bacterium]
MGLCAFRSLFVLLLLLPWVASALPDAFDSPCPKLLLKQVVERNGVSDLNPGGFSRHRTILEYLRIFPAEVGDKIAALGGDDLILEAGSGEGVAAEQLFGSNLESLLPEETTLFRQNHFQWELAVDPAATLKRIGNKSLKDRPRIIGVSKEMARNPSLVAFQGKLQFLKGRFFEDIPVGELGTPKLILDPIGVMSYTAHPSEVLKTYLDILAPGGDAYFFMDGSRIEIEMRRGFSLEDGVRAIKPLKPVYANRMRWLVEKEGSLRQAYFIDWLLSLNQPGLEVRELETRMLLSFEKDQKRFLRENRYTTIHVRKTGKGPVRIPRLELIKVDTASNPPDRFFKEVAADTPSKP